MITYTWEITGLKTANVGDKENAVVQTYWKKIGTDENGNQGYFSGATPFTVDPTDESGPFIPFNELTEEDVIEWIKTVIVGDYEEHVDRQIQKQIESQVKPVFEKSLPWNPPPIETPLPPEA